LDLGRTPQLNYSIAGGIGLALASLIFLGRGQILSKNSSLNKKPFKSKIQIEHSPIEEALAHLINDFTKAREESRNLERVSQELRSNISKEFMESKKESDSTKH
jgi:hypothetical protein